MIKRVLAVVRSLPFIVAAGVICLYALAGFVAAPWYLKRALPDLLKTQLQAAGSAGDIRINPFLMSLDVRDFTLTEAGGKMPAVAFDRLLIDFSMSSLFRFAWTFDEISLERPRLNLVVDEHGVLNLAKLKAAEQKPAPAPKPEQAGSASLPRLLLHNIALVQGSVSFTDLQLEEDPKAALTPIDIRLSELSTLPDRSGNYHLQAKLPAGGTLTWQGTLSLAPIASAGRLEVDNLKLATLWQFAQDKVLTEAPEGAAHVALNYNARYQGQKLEASAANIAARLVGVSVKARGQTEPVLTLAEAGLNGGSFDFAARKLHFTAFTLKQWSAVTELDEAGKLSWQKLFVLKDEPEPPAAPWHIAIDSIDVSGGRLRAVDKGYVLPLALDIASTELKAGLELSTGDKPQVRLANMALTLGDIRAGNSGGQDSLLTLAGISLEGGSVDLSQPEIRFAKLALGKGEIRTTLDAAGMRGLARRPVAPAAPAASPTPSAVAAATQAAPAKEADKEATKPLRFVIDAIEVPDLALHAIDERYAKPLRFDVAHADLRAALKAEFGAKPAIDVDGIAVNLNGLKTGPANVAAGTTDSKGDNRQPWASLASVTLAGGKLNLADQRFSADSVRLAGAAVALKRGADGQIDLVQAFAPRPGTPSGVAATPLRPAGAGRTTATNSGFGVSIGKVELVQGSVAFEDHTTEPPLRVNLQNLRLAARALDPHSRAPIPLEASFTLKQGGRFSARGSYSATLPGASARIEVKDVALAIAEPLVTRYTTLKFRSGTAGASGQFEWNGSAQGGLRYNGGAEVADLRIDEAGGDKLLAWQRLAAEGINYNSAENRVHVADLLLTAPGGKIAIAKDHSTNLSDVMRKPADAAAAPTAGEPADGAKVQAAATAPTPAPATPAAATGDAFAYSIERVRIDKGDLDFSDQSLVLPFGAVIREFNGAISGLSSRPGTRATIQMEGRVDEFGSARVDGTINVFEPKVYTDLAVIFRNVAMSPLTPYSATFAGRRIASGKLALDLHYKLINSELLGDNRVVLEKFTLGERVESPNAVNLPLDLAIALLTDGDGKIDLSVPVRGNVDRPEFAYGTVIWQAIRTVIVNIVSAPFRALASLMGGSGEKMDAILFAAGSAQLAPPEREKLTHVAGLLVKRPQLKLAVEGRFDPKRDAEVLRAAAARHVLAKRIGARLTGDDDPALVNYDQAKTQREIEKMLDERTGSGSVDRFKTAYEQKGGKPVNRVNPALALVGRASTDRAFYEALFNEVAAHEPLDNSALTALATRRATAVTAFFGGSGGTSVDAARISTKPPAQVSVDKDAEIATALSLETGQ